MLGQKAAKYITVLRLDVKLAGNKTPKNFTFTNAENARHVLENALVNIKQETKNLIEDAISAERTESLKNFTIPN